MDKSITLPVWLIALVLLLGLLFTASVAWAVRSTLKGSDRSGLFGEAALAVADFPGEARVVFTELREILSGRPPSPKLRVDLQAPLVDGPAEPLPGAAAAGLPGFEVLGAPAELTPGWRYFAGAFSIDDEIRNAVVIVSPEATVAGRVVLSEGDILPGTPPSPDDEKVPHGLTVLPDASFVVAHGPGVTLQRFSPCGDLIWAIPGLYHHAVEFDPARQTLWTLRYGSFDLGPGQPMPHGQRSRIEEISLDGDVLRDIALDDVIAANPLVDPLEIRRADGAADSTNHPGRPGDWLADPFHFNDIEPLQPEIAAAFPDFEAGDLVLSARSLNLVMVLDPESLAIRWWRIGEVKRQHDPDWQPDGTLTVFDNRTARAESRVVRLDPSRLGHEDVLAAGNPSFYTRFRGKHQILPNGDLIVISPGEGRVFEMRGSERVLAEFRSRALDRDGEGFLLTEAIWLPPEALNREEFACDR
ncbi:MAG: arylsulfotransferase family protein [Paracoccaceae bacterium]